MILVSGWVKVCYFLNTCLSCDISWNLLPNYVSFIKRSFHKSFFFSIVWIVECLINDSQITYYSKRIKTSYLIFFLFLFLFPTPLNNHSRCCVHPSYSLPIVKYPYCHSETTCSLSFSTRRSLLNFWPPPSLPPLVTTNTRIQHLKVCYTLLVHQFNRICTNLC